MVRSWYRPSFAIAGPAAVMLLLCVWSMAAAPYRITAEVATTADLTGEIRSVVGQIEMAVASEDAYRDGRGQVSRRGVELAMMAQALAEHREPSDLKQQGPMLRDAALELPKAKSLEDVRTALAQVKEILEGKSSRSAMADVDWNTLASGKSVMPILRERTDSIRHALRRPKDPTLESRNAMVVALIALAAHGDGHAVKSPSDQQKWNQFCLQLQSEFSKTAEAMRTKDAEAAAEHFRLGMEVCGHCHETFRP